VDFYQGKTITIMVERCEPTGCRAGLKLGSDLLQELIAGRTLKVSFHDAERKPIEMQVALAGFRAALDERGRPQAWAHRVAAPSVTQSFSDRLVGLPTPALPDKFQAEGAFDLPYAIPHVSVRQLLCKTPVPVGYWRSVGHSYNAFFTECFLYELAAAAGQDP
jgi:isoquinoline 1-oxidoreductase beta subunit